MLTHLQFFFFKTDRSPITEIEALKLGSARPYIAVPGKVIQIEGFLLYLWRKKEDL